MPARFNALLMAVLSLSLLHGAAEAQKAHHILDSTSVKAITRKGLVVGAKVRVVFKQHGGFKTVQLSLIDPAVRKELDAEAPRNEFVNPEKGHVFERVEIEDEPKEVTFEIDYAKHPELAGKHLDVVSSWRSESDINPRHTWGGFASGTEKPEGHLGDITLPAATVAASTAK